MNYREVLNHFVGGLAQSQNWLIFQPPSYSRSVLECGIAPTPAISGGKAIMTYFLVRFLK